MDILGTTGPGEYVGRAGIRRVARTNRGCRYLIPETLFPFLFSRGINALVEYLGSDVRNMICWIRINISDAPRTRAAGSAKLSLEIWFIVLCARDRREERPGKREGISLNDATREEGAAELSA